MRASRRVLVILTFVVRVLHASSPATLNNDDSCEISVAPAATLLLPYFEVDLSDAAEDTTLFTITNVGSLPQIARATIWTDRAYPVLTFNIFLTGYDVQSISLYDVLARGRITQPGTSSESEVGQRSADNDENVLLETSACENILNEIPPQILANLQSALTVGRTTTCGSARIGSIHTAAIGYVTIDVVRNCGSASPVDAGYFSTDILYDNVLIGDYQQLDRGDNFAQGSTLVHIRAIPEGGLSGSATTNFRRTFYSRLQNGGTADRRQPLPSTFAARWISGGVGASNTSVTIWREGVTSATAGCAVDPNLAMDVPDIVRFDEEENATVSTSHCEFIFTCPTFYWGGLSVQRIDVNNSGFYLAPNPQGDISGWMYFNLHNRYGQPPDGSTATQAWVIVSMAAEGRFSVDFDATPLGNGCSPRTPYTAKDGSAPFIGPAPNVNP